jgi:signal transduction histidine kinase
VPEVLQQQERLAAIGRVAAGVAHDFNNVVADISLSAQILESQPGLDRTGRDQVSHIRREADRAAAMVWQILDFAHRGPIDRTAVDLDHFLVDLLASIRLTQPPRLPIDFRADDADHRVLADPGRLEQVVANLVANANDAMPGDGRIDIDLSRVQVVSRHHVPVPGMAAGEWIRVDVSDTGVGIPSEVLPRMFEPFFSTKSPGHGTGLGLAQVNGLMTQHDGHVHATSAVGVGTTVTLWIPALTGVRSP